MENVFAQYVTAAVIEEDKNESRDHFKPAAEQFGKTKEKVR